MQLSIENTGIFKIDKTIDKEVLTGVGNFFVKNFLRLFANIRNRYFKFFTKFI